MRISNVFESTRDYLKADPKRMDGVMVEYGRQWRSRTLPASTLTLFWMEGTSEFYAQDLISFRVYLLDRKAKTRVDADRLLGPLKNKMTTGRIEDIFPEFADIAGRQVGAPVTTQPTRPPLTAPQAAGEASPSPAKPKAESKPNPYAKWARKPVDASGGQQPKTKDPNDDLPF